ncbi:MAG: DUF4333 domain-containing protein [Synechococcales bacterium]|nr:DUF4333 domain-containing protein [Synechococcales bacterium]
MKFHPFRIAGLILGAAAIASGCSPRLDTDAIAQIIHQELTQQSEVPVTEVVCPLEVEPVAEASFPCLGKLDEEKAFLIRVTQLDDQGSVEWRVPNSRSMLNLTELERIFQEEIVNEFGRSLAIDCGGTYRVNTPGESFNCQVLDPLVVDERRLEAIQVNLDSRGNINWQQIRNLMDEEELAILKEEMPDAIIELPEATEAGEGDADPENPDAETLPSEDAGAPLQEADTNGAEQVGQKT